MKASVVIPTKNEDKWIERTLSALTASKQSKEIIIVDNDCGVGLKKIASKYSCRLLKDTTPAKSRNSGAKLSSGDIIVFVDADIIVPPNCLDHATTIIEKNENIGLVHFKIKPMTDSKFINLSYLAMHYYFKMLSFWGFAQGIGNFIAVRRSVFDSIGGFDECIKVGEDADFYRRASKFTSISYISDDMVYASPRRYEVENPYVFSIKCIMWAILRVVGVKYSVIDYKWEKYPDHVFDNEERWIKMNLSELHIGIGRRAGGRPGGGQGDAHENMRCITY